MPLTFGQLKARIRATLWPQGEAANLVPAHDQSFLDALIDIQTWVPCEQQDNTSLFPQCATFYNCGLTTFDAPQGIIRKVSVMDKAHVIPSANVTGSKFGSVIVSNEPFFDRSMIGSRIKFEDGQSFTIASFIDSTHIAVIDTTPAGEQIMLGSNARINANGNLELFDPDDQLWHEVTLFGIGTDNAVQVGINQHGVP